MSSWSFRRSAVQTSIFDCLENNQQSNLEVDYYSSLGFLNAWVNAVTSGDEVVKNIQWELLKNQDMARILREHTGEMVIFNFKTGAGTSPRAQNYPKIIEQLVRGELVTGVSEYLVIEPYAFMLPQE